jgi:hypothetical protein
MGLLLFGFDRLPYDLATAWLWTLALLYIYERKYYEYLLIFLLACLNRETSFILIPFAWAYGFRQDLFYQVIIYMISFLFLHMMFADNPGGLWIQPWQNLQRFINRPCQSLIQLSIAGVISWFVFKGWHNKPVYLRSAFVFFASIFIPSYLIFGQAFEVRTLWELYPVTAALLYPWRHL